MNLVLIKDDNNWVGTSNHRGKQPTRRATQNVVEKYSGEGQDNNNNNNNNNYPTYRMKDE